MSFGNVHLAAMDTFGLVFIGLLVVLTKHNLIKVIIGLSILDTGINLFLVAVGYLRNGTGPIFSMPGLNESEMVGPVPQALVLTAIVIGVAVLALALGIAVRLYREYGVLDLRKIKELKW